jgi:hypothetical protein
MVVISNELLEFCDEFERFICDAFEICLCRCKKILKVKTDVLNVTDETFNRYFLCIHYDMIEINFYRSQYTTIILSL